MKYPKITVVTPSYNQGQFIERTILSVISQGYPNIEYFVCDGGSTDNTVDVIKKYENKIAWWCSEKDHGQTQAINKGMKRATGDICCWINSDDVFLPNALFKVAEFYRNHPECEFLNGTLMEIDKEDRIVKFAHNVMNLYFMQHGCFNICQQGMFWRRSLFEKIGYLDESFHAMMDLEWLIRVYESGAKVMPYKKPFGAIRVYAETKTAQWGSIWVIDEEKISKRYNGQYVKKKKTVYFFFFVLYKILKGCYLDNYIYSVKYKGKNVNSYIY